MPSAIQIKEKLWPFLSWLFYLGGCTLLLSGRYDWNIAEPLFARRGFLSSLYMMLLTLPILYYLLRFFLPLKRNFINGLLVAVTLLLVFPYHWLGLDRWYYHANQITFWSETQWISPQWLSLQRITAVIPHELILFSGLFVLGLFIMSLVTWQIHVRRQISWSGALAIILPWFGLYCLLLLQTWLHLSLRSPYTYTTLYAEDTIRTKFLFPEIQQGAVNSDYTVFRALEEHFMGVPRATNTMLIRRSYTAYLVTQFSYFTSPYYAWLIFNIGIWFMACVAGYYFARLFWHPSIAAYFAFLIGCGPGFIMFVAQPMSYMAGYATLIILLYLFERLIIKNEARSIGHYLLFASCLGVGLLVTDLFPFLLFFFGYAAMKRIPPRPLLFILLLSITIYSGFLSLQAYGIGLVLSNHNAKYMGLSIAGIMALLSQPDFGQIYLLTVRFFRLYIGNLGNAFFIIPVILASFGLMQMREKSHKWLIFLLILPTIIPMAMFHYGEVYWKGIAFASLPRLMYVAYPAIYLLAAEFLQQLQYNLEDRNWPTVARVTPWLILASIFILNNIDVLGYPEQYLLFYFADIGG